MAGKKLPKTPVKITREAAKKDEEPESKEEEDLETSIDNMEPDELVIKDETDPDGDFEEIDQVGEIEKDVSFLNTF